MNWTQLLSSRRLPEKSARDYDDSRPPWQIDHDRIIFSSAFRRLQDKTQVHPLSSSDYVRTRLTHSLEVSSVARTLGTRAGKFVLQKHGGLAYGGATLSGVLSPSDFGMITGSAALAHDIGNPPFGHSGEDAIRFWFATSDVAKTASDGLSEVQRADFERWEGNAEGFRILARNQMYQNEGGMRLTAASMGAYMKYPTASVGLLSKDEDKNVSAKKPGFFDADRAEWESIADELGLERQGQDRWCRHPLAFLTEAADDICYGIVDLEDGYRLGCISYSEISELLEQFLTDEDYQWEEKNKDPNERLVYLRAKAITRLVNETTEAFQDHETSLLAGTQNAELLSVIPSAKALKDIKDMTKQNVYSMRGVLEIETAGFKIIPGLLDVFVDGISRGFEEEKTNDALFARKVVELIPSSFLEEGRKPSDCPYKRLLSAVDFVAGMTDTFALDLFRKIRGVSIPR